MVNKNETGKRISLFRKNLNLSQAAFAEILNVSPQAVSRWETGQTLPEPDILLNLSWIFRVTINEILDSKEIFTDPSVNVPREMYRMNNLLACPQCKLHLNMQISSGSLHYVCENAHCFEVEDGVVYFGSREIQGEEWSLWLRNYEHYLNEANSPGLPRYAEGEISYKEVMWREIEKLHPRTIVDIASGTGSGIKYIVSRINWRCTVILTDLSYRLLSWNRRYFTEKIFNPFVDYVFLACDCSVVPLRDNSIDLVFSNGGFESAQDKMQVVFHEAHRILKPGGCAVYNMSLVDNHESDNTKKWSELFMSLGADMSMLRDITQWIAVCEATGFTKNEAIKIYNEMSAPDTRDFPFENQVLRWMACYVLVSHK